jgi:hypothetical protein
VDEELYAHVPNSQALDFLTQNIPLFECPDSMIQQTFYFRWWTFRKHVKMTTDGYYVITEFMNDVSWSGKHNAIVCPVGHHFYEGRWLHNSQYLDDYAVFWYREGGSLRAYSNWLEDGIYAYYKVTQDSALALDLLDDMISNYTAWENDNLESDGLFWSVDDRDGMEVAIGGTGKRPTINSYMYAGALAIAAIAGMAGRPDVVQTYTGKAADIKSLVQQKLWDLNAKFFKVLPRDSGASLVDVREELGYTPWYANLPEPGQGYEEAWAQLMDPDGFYAAYDPTTAEQRHPQFTISYEGHECQWNGPSWPLSTSVTLTGLANVLNNYEQDVIDREDYFKTLKIYTNSHKRYKEEIQDTVPWIDENLNPFTGDWISRTRLSTWNNGTWDDSKGGYERGKDYNHSTYNDLIITGLAGLRPRADNIVEVNPLVPADTWDYFALDNVLYHGKILTILWDRTGERYRLTPGLMVLIDGELTARSDSLERVTVDINASPLVSGCTDPAYVEFDPIATIHVQDSCKTLTGVIDPMPGGNAGDVVINSRELIINGSGWHSVRIWDVGGAQIFSAQGRGTSSYSLELLPKPGVYHLRVETAGKVIDKRMVNFDFR